MTQTAIKERAIIFTGWSIPKILDGTKTQTRRTYGLEFVNQDPGKWIVSCYQNDNGFWAWFATKRKLPYEQIVIKCPYGQVGDRLWVKETWRIESFMEGEPLLFGYKDGQTMEENEYGDTPTYESWYERIVDQSTEDAKKAFSKGLVRRDESGDYYKWDIGKSPCRWRSPRFMPRCASRTLREITDVRAERLQGISELDIKAEGWPVDRVLFPEVNRKDKAEKWFSNVWDSINPKHPWVGNWWVWPIGFKEV